jgi:hypothetical protein
LSQPSRAGHAGKHTSADLAELFPVARSTVYRAVARAGAHRHQRRLPAHEQLNIRPALTKIILSADPGSTDPRPLAAWPR